jgi:predicted metalloprotease with PDZ domain
MGEMIGAVISSPARRIRTAEEMSAFAPFVDAAVAIDPTNFENTFLSYYTWGGALGIGLDLTLRDRSDGRVTLDHFMRALWERHGKPGGRVPGYVDRPYAVADLRNALADVSGDRVFADDFFARFVQGHEVVDYRGLLARAGLVLRQVNRGQASAGRLTLQDSDGKVRVAAPVPFDSPAYTAGLDRDDVVVSIGGVAVSRGSDFEAAIRSRRPGESVPLIFERRGQRVTATVRLVDDPQQEVVTVETAGQALTDAQKRFRDAWLSSLQ